MEEALGSDGHGFLEQHDALVGLVAEELQGGEAAGRFHVEMFPTARGYHKALWCVHGGVSFPAAKLRRAACRERPLPAIPRETDHVHLTGGSRARAFGDTPRAG